MLRISIFLSTTFYFTKNDSKDDNNIYTNLSLAYDIWFKKILPSDEIDNIKYCSILSKKNELKKSFCTRQR